MGVLSPKMQSVHQYGKAHLPTVRKVFRFSSCMFTGSPRPWGRGLLTPHISGYHGTSVRRALCSSPLFSTSPLYDVAQPFVAAVSRYAPAGRPYSTSCRSTKPNVLEVPLGNPEKDAALDNDTSSQDDLNPATVTAPLSSVPKLLVIIDLDETLFFSHLNRESPHDFSVVVEKQEIFVSLRPGCRAFLSWCKEHFETGLYTAGTELYAKTLLKIIDPTEQLIVPENHRYRQACWPVVYEVKINDKSIRQTLYAKDLSLFRKDLSRVVLIDNSLFSFILQPDNGILITDWRGSLDSGSAEPSIPAGSETATKRAGVSDVPIAAQPASSGSFASSLSTTGENPGASTGPGGPQLLGHLDVPKHSTDGQQDLIASQEAHFAAQQVKEDTAAAASQSLLGRSNVSDSSAAFQEAESPSSAPEVDEEQRERELFGDFYPIKKILEELQHVEDVKPLLRQRFRLVDHIVRRCISGMMISNRM